MKEFEKYVNYKPQATGIDSITIEKDVKMPKKNGRLHSVLSDEVRNTLKTMQVGDSFEVKNMRHVQIIQNYGRNIGRKFPSRKYFVGEKKIQKNVRWRIWYERDFFEHEINKWNPDTKNPYGVTEKELKEAFLKSEEKDVLSAGAIKKKSNSENYAKSDFVLIQNKIIFLENCIAGIHESFLEVTDLMKEEKVFRNTKTFKKWRETHQKLEQIRKNIKDQIS